MQMVTDQLRENLHRIVIMGVAGCGKSTVGTALARQINAVYLEGDALHPASNIARMSRGEPLADADRWPWLNAVADALAKADSDIVVGCSALKRAYRDRIRSAAGHPVLFVYLAGSRQLIERRMAYRKGHFMPPSLIDSQFATLEIPQPDEHALVIDLDLPVDRIVMQIADAVQSSTTG